MKRMFGSKLMGRSAVAIWLTAATLGFSQNNFTVTSPNYIYAIDGTTTTKAPGFFTNNCPPLTLTAGQTYTFTMQASAVHPMVIVTQNTGPIPSSFEYSNASPQIVSSGVITFTIPETNFPSQLYYQCDFHGFYGVITIVPPVPPPPPNQILSLSVTTNIVLISTGTNTAYNLVPQFSSNITSGVWQAVPSYSNSFNNGTNITVFDRLDAICGSKVFLRISQQPPN